MRGPALKEPKFLYFILKNCFLNVKFLTGIVNGSCVLILGIIRELMCNRAYVTRPLYSALLSSLRRYSGYRMGNDSCFVF